MDDIRDKVKQLSSAFPDLDFSKITINGEGLTHRVAVVDGRRVFRFPMDEWARRSLKQELLVLEILRPTFPLALPAYDFVTDDVASYPYLTGKPFSRNRWLKSDPQKQRQLAGQMRAALSAMHRITPAAAGSAAMAIGPSLTVRTAADWFELYERVRTQLYPALMTHAREWVDELFAPLQADPSWMDCSQPVLMNGDIGVYHTLFDEERGAIAGMIDFGTAGWGDPACDIACLLYQYGERFVKMMAELDPIESAVINRARFWAGTLELQWALGGLNQLKKEIDLSTQLVDWSWFTVHIGFGARDVNPIGAPF